VLVTRKVYSLLIVDYFYQAVISTVRNGMFWLQLNKMAVQVSIPGYHPRMRLEAPASVYFPPNQNVSASSAPELLAAAPSVVRSLGPAVVPGVAPPSRSINPATSVSSGASGPLGPMDGRRMRSKSVTRRTVDYNASLINCVQVSWLVIILRYLVVLFFVWGIIPDLCCLCSECNCKY